jgi:hypothetical protein
MSALHVVAERFVTSMILLNLPIAAWAELTHNETAERIDTAILVFFACEIGVRIAFACKRRHCDMSLLFDALIVLLAFTGLPIARAARLGHLTRNASHLRHVVTLRSFKLTRVRQLARVI